MDMLKMMQQEMQKRNQLDEARVQKDEIRDKVIQSLTTQMGQLATDVSNLKKNKGELPSDTKENPTHTTSCNVRVNQAIKQVPAYAKFLEELCTQKRQQKVPKRVDLTDRVSAILKGDLPPKLQDPRAPLINIQVGDFQMSRALLDLGVGVSILPGGLFNQYDFGPLKRVETTVVLADLSHKLPRGIVWDVIVHICALELEERKQDALALQEGRPPCTHQYAFLGEGETLPVIIASNLDEAQDEGLLKVLKAHKAEIGWTIADLKGISPSIVMHKIITTDDAKPTQKTQRRLNPNLREVVKKEVIKWLDAGIIYPISDSAWVSPTQVVPKKAGIQRFIKGFSVITKPLCNLLLKDVAFDFTNECSYAFDVLKEKLVQAPILQPPDWTKTFEIMCDASDTKIGAVLGQRIDKKTVVIYYASKTLSKAQLNSTTTEKELLAMVYALDKFGHHMGK
ncbi:uncharacterized protein LOC143620459 [Bidens hawaiensis]|uniref:uncharacterized protein LOC143620459 n=1 Tax=Bidens hawaiensis TaxID=980011 RepID=UPI00404ABBCB